MVELAAFAPDRSEGRPIPAECRESLRVAATLRSSGPAAATRWSPA